MEFFGESAAGLVTPDEATLRAHFEANRARFAAPARIAFAQVLLEAPGDEAARATLAALEAGAAPAEIGRRSLLPARMDLAPRAVVDGAFGAGFFEAIAALPPGEWRGPVRSSFGTHLVRLERLAASEADFAAVRGAVEADWRRAEAERLRAAQFAALRARYRVSLPKGLD